MNERCVVCGDRLTIDNVPMHDGFTCSPECARTKAIVDAIKGINSGIAHARESVTPGSSTELSSSYPR